MARRDEAGQGAQDYVRLIRRQLWLIVVVALIVGAGAYVYSRTQTPQYGATAQLLYEPAIDATSSSSQSYVDPNAQQLQVDSAALVITGPDVTERVVAQLGSQSEWPPYSISAAASSSAASSSGSSYSTGVDVYAASTDAAFAAKLANAYAKEYITWRQESQQQAYTEAAAVVKGQLESFKTAEEKDSSEYIILAEQLRSLEVKAATATGDFTLIVPATAPSVPFAPKPNRSALLGLAVGLVIGLGFAFLREKLDTRVRNHRDVGEAVGLPVVGRIPVIQEASLASGPLVVLRDADTAAANAFRLLRSNLGFASLGDEHRTIIVASALKSEGKSVTAANLAASLALTGKRVLLIDADLRRPQVHQLFGIRNAAGVSTLVAGQGQLDQAVQKVELAAPLVTTNAKLRGSAGRDNGEAPALWILPAGPLPPNPGEMLASQRFASLIDSLTAMSFDYILIDSPAFLSVGDATEIAACADGLLLIVNLRLTRKPILEETTELLAPLPIPKLGVVIVGDHLGRDDRYAYYSDR